MVLGWNENLRPQWPFLDSFDNAALHQPIIAPWFAKHIQTYQWSFLWILMMFQSHKNGNLADIHSRLSRCTCIHVLCAHMHFMHVIICLQKPLRQNIFHITFPLESKDDAVVWHISVLLLFSQHCTITVAYSEKTKHHRAFTHPRKMSLYRDYRVMKFSQPHNIPESMLNYNLSIQAERKPI